MKKVRGLLLLSVTGMLASCGNLSIIVHSQESEIDSHTLPNVITGEVMRLDAIAVALPKVEERETPVAFESLPKKDITVYCLDSLNDGFYVSLSTFGALIAPYLSEGLTVKSDADQDVASVRVYDGEYECYRLSVDSKEETITQIGDGTPLYPIEASESDPELKAVDHILVESPFSQFHGFADSGIRHFEADGEERYDLSFLENETRRFLNCHFAADAHNGYLYQYRDEAELTQGIARAGKTTTIGHILTASYAANYRGKAGQWLLPRVLREQQRNLYCYFLAQEEGLWGYRGVMDPLAYLSSLEGYGDLDAEDEKLRADGYARLTASFDDLNAVYSSSPWLGEAATDPKAFYGVNSALGKRDGAKTRVTGLRKGYVSDPNAIRYNEDQTLAMAEVDRLDETGFLLLKSQLATLNENKSVTDVILDLSLCEAGTSASFYKTLALISPQNEAKIYVADDEAGTLAYRTLSVDVNGDGEFFANETYGKRFRFHLAQSAFTARVGNQLCAYADKLGFASLLGDNGNGGECKQDKFTLPLGQKVSFSSAAHQLWINQKGRRESLQYGASPSCSWGYEASSYDMEALSARLGIAPKA